MLLNSDVLWLAALVPLASGFYLPGAAPRDYKSGDPVDLFVNALTPKTNVATPKLKSLIDYDYYHPQFHFCQPEGGPQSQGASLGAILFGDRIFNSPIKIQMMKNVTSCQTICTTKIPKEDAAFINQRIMEDYTVNWLVDGLPAAEQKKDTRSNATFYDIGFEVGDYVPPDDEETPLKPPTFNNVYDIVLQYHTKDNKNFRVVGVLVWPSSDSALSGECGQSKSPLILSEEKDTNEVRFAYRVSWEASNTRWATRWDNYLHIFDPRIHWFSLVNSLIIAVFLCAMVSMIIWRNVSRDISRYNAMDLSEDVQEDYGWKLVHGEVFRSPNHILALSVCSGIGAQLCFMFGVTLVFAVLGFLSPSNRGSLATVMLVFYTFFGGFAGYVSARVYSSLEGKDFGKNIFITATIFPTVIFAVIFLLNFLLVTAGSSGAVPFGTMLVIVLLWFGISAPLSVFGSHYGRKHGPVSHPVRVNRIPRQIPPPPRYLRPFVAAILAGILPFGAAFVELYFVMSSLFASRAYYAFGFLALTAAVVTLTTAAVTILFTYFMLCAEEYRWHWRAFLVGGGSAFWILGYGIFYWLSRLSLDSLTSVMLYFGYLLLVALFDFLITGTIGFLASYWAIRRLYSAIRID